MMEEKTRIPRDLQADVASYLERQCSLSSAGEIRFQDLTVHGAGNGIAEAPTVPTAFADVLKMFEPSQYLRPAAGPSRVLLDKFCGSVRAGEMVLVLSKPGGGCSTTLKSLAGMRGQFKSTSGDVTYGGLTLSEMMRQRPGFLAYCGEQDTHFGTLSVETTLRFAVDSRTPRGAPSRKEKIDKDVEAIVHLFGLSGALKTPVQRVSGGQRRRVSLAESFITNADLLCLDNPTAGLDSSTALRLVQMLRTYVDQRQSACVVAAYQAADSLCELFDKVLVINRGRQIYFGPTNGAVAHFEALGFQRPSGATLADFLTIMSGEPRSWPKRDEYIGYMPRCAEDLQGAFRQSSVFQLPKADASSSGLTAATREGPATADFALPAWRQIYLCTIRQLRILITDKSAWMTEGIATVIQALVIGTIFFNEQSDTSSLYSIGSAMFLSVLTVALRAAAELRVTFSQRPLLLKQKHLRFYRPGCYAIAQIFSDIPWKVLSVVYNIPLYFMVHFQWRAGHFFVWFLSLYLAFQATSLMFRAIAVFTVSPDKAALPVGLWLNVLIIYAGFYVPIPQMKVWLGWLRFLDPMHYAYETMMINQFWNLDYACSTDAIAPRGSSYVQGQFQTCAIAGSSPGQLTVTGQSYLQTQFDFQYAHLWRNVGINASFFVVFSLAVAYGMERFKPAAGRLATVFFKQGGLNASPTKPAQSDVESQSASSEPFSQADLPQKTADPHYADTAAVLNRTGHVFAWKDICLDAQSDGKSKRLLANVSGWTKPGLTALMGGSGAGKSTLMNALAQRPSPSPVMGDFFLDGRPLQSSIKRRMGYVYQQDVHLPTSTVREALQFAARLRQDSNESTAKKHEFVESIIMLLEMEDIADALIGTPGAGLSMEKRKRASIGVELAAKPDAILFLDEPTSGLDSDSALSVVRILRKVADAGQAVLCVIHQPAAQLITQFDSLMVLVPGGKTAYFGEMGSHCQTAVSYFTRHSRPLRTDENPAEYIIDVVGNDSTEGADWSEIWKKSPEGAQVEAELSRLTLSSEKASIDEKATMHHYAAGYWEQFIVVLQRALRNYWREPTYAVSKILMLVFNALLNGLTFLQLPLTVSDARGRIFSMFVASITAPPQMVQLEPRFIAFRNIFAAREKANHSYHWSILVITSILVELPYAFTGALLYWVLWYYTVGLPYSSDRAAYAWLMYELYTFFYTALGQGIASVMPTLQSALLMTPFVFLVVNTFAGPLSPPPVTPRGWRWFFNISPQFYLVEGMETDFLHGKSLSCTQRDLAVFNAPPNMTCGGYAADFLASAPGFLKNPQDSGACQYCPYATGDQYLQQYSYSWEHRGRDTGAYIGFLAFNWTVAALGTYLLFVKQWRKRRG